MSRLSPMPRSDSRASATSDTTYHSFCDAELPEPIPACEGTCDAGKDAGPSPAAYDMRRQDSGYESLTPRDSRSSYRRRKSSSASVTSSTPRPRTRPAVRRVPKSAPVAYIPRNSTSSIYPALSSHSSRQEDGSAYFHFPHFPFPEQASGPRGTMSDSNLVSSTATMDSSYPHTVPSSRSETPVQPLPPQTTHYWTSDRTRRLEYAAIDAASRGVRGWVMRHMVPDCFVPKDRRRIGFEDDRGSVVRYRLELEGDDNVKRVRKGWWFSTRNS